MRITASTIRATLTASLTLIMLVDFCHISLALAQGQKLNNQYEGWHKVPDPSHIQYKVFDDKVVALSNLSRSVGCSSFSFAGKIAKANFDQEGLMVQSFVLETNDGERSLIN